MMLLRAGADAKAKDGAGRTAFDYAQGNEKLKGSAAYLKIKEASFAQATRHFLYVTNNGSNNVSAYTINPSTGALTAVTGSLFPAGTSPIGIAVNPTGKYLYVANNNSATWDQDRKEWISGSAINSITGAIALASFTAAGIRPRGIVVDPKGRFLCVANSSSDNVSVFTINPSNGALTPSGSPVAAGASPSGISVDPTGNFLYVANTGSANVSAYAINSTTGALSKVGGSPFPTGAAPHGVAADPTGKFVYIANNGSANVSAYMINRSTGALSEVRGSPFPTGVAPLGVAVDPTGEIVYVANKSSSNVSAYVIIPSTGALSEIAGSPFPAGVAPNDITIAEVTIP